MKLALVKGGPLREFAGRKQLLFTINTSIIMDLI